MTLVTGDQPGQRHPVEPGQSRQGAGVGRGVSGLQGERGARRRRRALPARASTNTALGVERTAESGSGSTPRQDGQPIAPQLGVPGVPHALAVEVDLHGGERDVDHPLAERP